MSPVTIASISEQSASRSANAVDSVTEYSSRRRVRYGRTAGVALLTIGIKLTSCSAGVKVSRRPSDNDASRFSRHERE